MIKKAKEDYLRAIYHLAEEQEAESVSAVDVRKYLGISKASVSEMMKKLAAEKLIDSKPYKKITLTTKGRKEAEKITQKHRIIEAFLAKMLDIKSGSIHGEADRLEHAFSDESIASIYRLIKNAKTCPHGKLIPKTR